MKLEIGTIEQMYKEAREITLDFESGKNDFSQTQKRTSARKSEHRAINEMVKIFIGTCKMEDKIGYKHMLNLLIGKGNFENNRLLIQPPSEVYNRTQDRGK